MAIVKENGVWLWKTGQTQDNFRRPEIIAWRERYLRRIRKIREADPERATVYTDETWLNQGHRTKKEWIDLETLKEKNLRSLRLSGLTVGCTKEMTSKGRRLIISDAMTESGPVRGALWMFKADGKGKKREQLDQNQKNFQERRNVASWILKTPKRRKIQQTGEKMTLK